jgi:hypothetical protein
VKPFTPLQGDSGDSVGGQRKAAALLRRAALTLLNDEVMRAIFDHARNLVVATLIFAAGMHATRTGESIPSVVNVEIAGYIVAATGAVLLVLNLADGLRKLSTVKRHTLLQLLLVAIYVVVSIRVAQLVLVFRTW